MLTPELTPAQKQKRFQAAIGYLELGMPDAALRELKPFADDDADASLVLRLRGEALREKEDHRSALSLFEKLLSQRPDDLQAAVSKAWCQKRLGGLDDAIATLEASARHHRREAILQYNLACYYALAGDKTRCLSHLGVSLRIDRDYARMVADESDFDPVREDPDFVRLLEMATTVIV